MTGVWGILCFWETNLHISSHITFLKMTSCQSKIRLAVLTFEYVGCSWRKRPKWQSNYATGGSQVDTFIRAFHWYIPLRRCCLAYSCTQWGFFWQLLSPKIQPLSFVTQSKFITRLKWVFVIEAKCQNWPSANEDSDGILQANFLINDHGISHSYKTAGEDDMTQRYQSIILPPCSTLVLHYWHSITRAPIHSFLPGIL